MDINKIKSFFVDFYEGFKNDEQKRNRVLILFLVFIGACSVVIGFSNTKETIKKPFVDKEKEAISSIYDTYNQLKAQGKIKDDTSNSVKNTDTSKSAYSDVDAKNTDTDGDGISDYDEVNIFKTSAFLADSDGDGISDYDEVKNGTDANCPVGKDCSTTSTTNKPQDNNADTNYNSIDPNKIDVKQARIELEKIIPESLKPMLANMTDDQVKSLMSQLYSGSTTSNNSSTTTNNTTNNTDKNSSITNTTNLVADYKSVLKTKLPQFSAAQIAIIKEMNEVDIKKLLLDSNIADESLLSSFKTGELKSTVLGE